MWGDDIMREFIDETTEKEGTPINRDNLMAIQGFETKNTNIVEGENGSYTITEINPENNHKLTTTITENEDETTTIVEIFAGEKTITKTTIVSADGNIISEAVN